MCFQFFSEKSCWILVTTIGNAITVMAVMGVMNKGSVAMATTGKPIPNIPFTLPESTKANIIEAIVKCPYGSKIIKLIFAYKLRKLHQYHM